MAERGVAPRAGHGGIRRGRAPGLHVLVAWTRTVLDVAAIDLGAEEVPVEEPRHLASGRELLAEARQPEGV